MHVPTSLPYSGTDPEINQGGWLAHVGFKLGNSFIMCISHHSSRILKQGFGNVGLACIVCEAYTACSF